MCANIINEMNMIRLILIYERNKNQKTIRFN